MSLDSVIERALRIVKPSERDREKLRELIDKALFIVREKSAEVPGVLDVTLEGSAAKNTWIKGRMEADIFVHFDPEVDKDELEKLIVEIGRSAIRELGGTPVLMYA
ncbi:MAG: nucleotidyltransferase domain-containing protein, partial [Thaumarchaeota archaeon]|nr:nucleotidyltransferase domain-containing protein [Nitrososphaerota archaeon]